MTTQNIILGSGELQTEPGKPTSGTVTFVPSTSKQVTYTQEDLERINKERIAVQGRMAWSFKHKYLGCDPQWHELWELLIPRNGCSCSNDYAKLKEENPPDFSSPEKYFLWGHRIHNLVNMKLEKPLITIAEAIKLWNRTDITLPTD